MNPRSQLVPVGEALALGELPTQMHAYVIRAGRFGVPTQSFVPEVIDVWIPGPGEVLVRVMAAGVNFNGIWAGLGSPVNILANHGLDLVVPGSDASGVVWAIGEGVTGWKVGDEVVLHCNHLLEPGASDLQTIWGYETPDGAFAQFTRVQSQQLLRKPPQLSWEEAASYGLTYYTAHRMLVDRAKVQPGEVVLVWGAAGGLGVFAVQLAAAMGARPIAVVSSDDKAELCLRLGAVGVINRAEFPALHFRDDMSAAEQAAHGRAIRAFGERIWQILGERTGPDVVFEHVGKSTFPASVFLANRYGRIVICGATTGYQLTFDVRHLWMRQKQIIGSHFADADSCRRANALMRDGKVKPVLTRVFTWEEIPEAHQLMYENKLHGTVACLVGAARPGLTSYGESLVGRADR
ncbi:MAG: crotonyl-CoA carboxylase/reductase [Deltaproteobacteria bacterium]|nr:crotonyl-CoA carboxylase/reductase [Deltaproteobacteria bacterium]